MRSLLALSDVMCTGHHAAVSASVKPGSVVAIVGDGAVGLCAVIAARRLGAAPHHRPQPEPRHRTTGPTPGGLTDILSERGEAATEAVLQITDGVGVDAALECVGTGQSMATALGVARAGSTVGYVGVPHGIEIPVNSIFYRNIGVRGGQSPVRHYIPELLDDVLEGRVQPGRVFDLETDLDISRRRTPRWTSAARSSRSCGCDNVIPGGT
jgi:threonine dehydrogenase-like Zn-dependent dehydrogenase